MPKVLKITLSKSLIGQVPKNVKTAHALGLRKIGQSTVNHPTDSIKGMVHQVKHLVTVVEVEADGDVPRKRRGLKSSGASESAKPAKIAPKPKPEALAAKSEPKAAATEPKAVKPAPKRPAAKKPTTKKKTED